MKEMEYKLFLIKMGKNEEKCQAKKVGFNRVGGGGGGGKRQYCSKIESKKDWGLINVGKNIGYGIVPKLEVGMMGIEKVGEQIGYTGEGENGK